MFKMLNLLNGQCSSRRCGLRTVIACAAPMRLHTEIARAFGPREPAMRRRWLFAASVLITPAHAETVSPVPGAQNTFIYKDAQANEMGRQLSMGGFDDMTMYKPLAACSVVRGTRVVITNRGFMTHDVLVVDGPARGCSGNIDS